MFINSLRIGKVTAVHPEAHAIDLTWLDDGSRVPMVQVLSLGATSNSGVSGLPIPSPPIGGNPADVRDTGDRDMYAVCGFIKNTPVVLGFLYPQVCQMLFGDLDREIHRHASDFYTSIDGAGNFEAAHPSGTYVRIGTAPAHEDLTGKDFDGQWKITKNTAAAVHLHAEVANAGTVKATIDIDPSGNVTVTNAGTVSWTSTGAATLKAPAITLDGPVTVTKDLTVDGTTGVEVPNGNVTASGIDLDHHVHTGVQFGSSTSGGPTG